ncbi:unnamed protein product [Camellia sinensis]
MQAYQASLLAEHKEPTQKEPQQGPWEHSQQLKSLELTWIREDEGLVRVDSFSPFPDEGLEGVFSLLKSHKDRSSISLLCRDWYNAERWTRTHCFNFEPIISLSKFFLTVDFDILTVGWCSLAWTVSLLMDPCIASSMESLKPSSYSNSEVARAPLQNHDFTS